MYRKMYRNRRGRIRKKISNSYKQQITNLLTKQDMFDTFPKWLLNDNYIISVDGYEPQLNRISFNYRRPISEMINEDKDIGNEQRGQDTNTKLSPKSKSKKKWDGVVYSAGASNVEGAPLISVVRGYSTAFYSDFLHRRILFEKVTNDEYLITHEPEDRYKNFYKGDDSIINKPFSKWSPKVKNKFLSTNLTSVVNVYTSPDLQVNLTNKSLDFVNRNDNVKSVQKVHCIESEVNNLIKKWFGLRVTDYTESEGVVTAEKHWDYNDIRKNCPLPLIRDKNMKGVTGPGKGYDSNYNRILNTGYKFCPKTFESLKPYMIGMEMFYIWDKCDFKNHKYVDLSWEGDYLSEWVKTRKGFTEDELKDFKNKCIRFSYFYNRLQDMENLKVLTTSKMFSYKREDIICMWMLFLELDFRGKFFDYSKLEFFGLELEIVKLMNEFKKSYDLIPDDDVENFFSHKRSWSSKNGQKKTMNAFFKVFLQGKFHKMVDDKIVGNWEIDKSKYYKWDYKFQDPKTVFNKKLQSESYDGMDGKCWVTGHDLTHNNMHAHHIIYREHGGKTTSECNCGMVLDSYNTKLFTKYRFSSDGIKELLKSPNTFMSEKREMWKSYGLEDLIKYEKDSDNYYWPSK